MITSKTAIDKAIAFLESLGTDYLGGYPKNFRLETIQRSGNDWVVIMSYTISVPRNGENLANPLLEALSTRRYLKEVEIDAESGEAIAMRNPQSPASAHEHQTI
jgi:hypothetical protein